MALVNWLSGSSRPPIYQSGGISIHTIFQRIILVVKDYPGLNWWLQNGIPLDPQILPFLSSTIPRWWSIILIRTIFFNCITWSCRTLAQTRRGKPCQKRGWNLRPNGHNDSSCSFCNSRIQSKKLICFGRFQISVFETPVSIRNNVIVSRKPG